MNLNSKSDYRGAILGNNGSLVLTDGTALSAVDITHFTAVELSVLEYTQSKGDTTISITVPAGVTVYGCITGITVTTGKVLVYLPSLNLASGSEVITDENGQIIVDDGGEIIII